MKCEIFAALHFQENIQIGHNFCKLMDFLSFIHIHENSKKQNACEHFMI
jgi:hypothetical protein